MLSVLSFAPSWSSPVAGTSAGQSAPVFDRRALLAGAFAGAAAVVAPQAAVAQIESVNPANNYYVSGRLERLYSPFALFSWHANPLFQQPCRC